MAKNEELLKILRESAAAASSEARAESPVMATNLAERLKKGPKEHRVSLTCYVRPAIVAKLEELSEQTRRTTSNLIEMAIAELLNMEV